MPYPSGNYYGWNTVYTTATNLPNGLILGQEVWDAQAGIMYKLYQANGAIAANASFKRDPANPAAGNVVATAAVTDGLEGVNDQSSSPGTGVALVSGNCFWGTNKGDAFPVVTNAVAAGVTVGPGAVAGVLNTGVSSHIRAVTLAASTGVATKTRLY